MGVVVSTLGVSTIVVVTTVGVASTTVVVGGNRVVVGSVVLTPPPEHPANIIAPARTNAESRLTVSFYACSDTRTIGQVK